MSMEENRIIEMFRQRERLRAYLQTEGVVV